MNDTSELEILPVFPLRKMVLYPYVVAPLSAGRPASVAALDAALASEDKAVVLLTQRDMQVEHPLLDDLYMVGTKAVIKRMARADETIEVVIQGMERIRLIELEETTPYLRAWIEPMPVEKEEGAEIEALQRELIHLASEYMSLTQPVPEFDLKEVVSRFEDPMHLVYFLATVPVLDIEHAQALLDASTHMAAMKLLHKYLAHELEVLKLRREMAGKVQTGIGQQQRKQLLRQQLRAIQEELGEQSPEKEAVAMLRQRMDEAKLPEHIRKEAERELSRMERIPDTSPDHQVVRTYLELVLELPWTAVTEDRLDLAHARNVLDTDHYGLKEIKERILEHLAVLKLNPEAKAPILCFIGPPGVGKTSLGQSIARALGRHFERFSLGGLHDESELRGHRRTYVGAMPGRIIQAIRRAGVKNPLLMLDEVDKLGRDFRGDPASALLEILDPAQNHEFRDNYLDLPFNLSNVFFITTANTLSTIPGALLDRMEIIRLSGYSDEEKREIANRYLLPRQREQAGVSDRQFILPDETLMTVIRRYTREAGVRELERMLGRLARKAALQFAEGRTEPLTVHPGILPEMLGAERFFLEEAREELPPGVATGLAWTESGGDVLYVEAILLPEGEELTLTGQLGDVMQESAKAARNYMLSQSDKLGVERPHAGIHIHVPAGAIPKDGPSAGVTMATAVASLYTGEPVRNDIAMTGELTLTGLVLPVGGIKEKVLAAHRAGIRHIILPARNEKDLRDLPDTVRQEMEFIFAEHIENVLDVAIPGLAGRLRIDENQVAG